MTLWAFLGLPFSATVGLPFPYQDQPWYVSNKGAIVIAVTWGIIITLLMFISDRIRQMKKTNRKARPVLRAKRNKNEPNGCDSTLLDRQKVDG